MLSIVIASHRPQFVTQLLPALLSQRDVAAEYEIICVCDYPVVALTREYPAVRFHYLGSLSISAKRNVGVSHAAGDAIAFIDDDCVPMPHWLARGVDYLKAHPECAGVEGLTLIDNTDLAIPALSEYHRLEQPGFRTNNIFYRTRALLSVQVFDERFTVQREDIDLAFSLLEKGFVIHHHAEIQVTHAVRKGERWDLLKNCVNRRFDPLLFKKHPVLYREHIETPFPPSLLLLLGIHGVLIAALFLGSFFTVAAFVADGIAIVFLTIRRCRNGCSITAFISEIAAVALAPLVLCGALIYGSIRYKKFLFV